MQAMPTLCVCGGMGKDWNAAFSEKCRMSFQKCVQALVKNHWSILCGGVKTGVLGCFLDIVQKQGGSIKAAITKDEQPDILPGVQSVTVFEHYEERQKYMFDQADRILFLPGGLGTIHELFSFLLIRKMEALQKDFFLLSVDGFWSTVPLLLCQIVTWGCVKSDAVRVFLVENEKQMNFLAKI